MKAACNVSIVVTVYIGDSALFLKECLESICAQTLNDFETVLVMDGPVTVECEEVISSFKERLDLNVIALTQNRGRSEARNIGIQGASGHYIAIMDSDDLCLFDRLEKQCSFLDKHHEIGLVASWQEEFMQGRERNVFKTCPESHSDIARALKFRCLIPNPSIMFRKNVFEDFGGYDGLKHSSEDHDLFSKWISKGVKFYCFQEPLIKVRVTVDQLARRGGWLQFKDDLIFRKRQLSRKQVSLSEYCWYIVIFSVFRSIPIPLKQFLYRLIRN